MIIRMESRQHRPAPEGVKSTRGNSVCLSVRNQFFLFRITNDYHLLGIKYWPSSSKYQQVVPSTDPVPSITNTGIWNNINLEIFSQLDVILIHNRGRVWPGRPVIFLKLWSGNGEEWRTTLFWLQQSNNLLPARSSSVSQRCRGFDSDVDVDDPIF